MYDPSADRSSRLLVITGVTFQVYGEGVLNFGAPLSLGDTCGLQVSRVEQVQGRPRKQNANLIDGHIHNIEERIAMLKRMNKEQDECAVRLDCAQGTLDALDANITLVMQELNGLERDVDKLRELDSHDVDVHVDVGAYMDIEGEASGSKTLLSSLVIVNEGQLILSDHEIPSERAQDELVVHNKWGGVANLSRIAVVSKYIKDGSGEHGAGYCGMYCCSHGFRLVNQGDAYMDDLLLIRDWEQEAACSDALSQHRGLAVENSRNAVAVDRTVSGLRLRLGEINTSLFEQIGPSIESKSPQSSIVVYVPGGEEKFEWKDLQAGGALSRLRKKNSEFGIWVLAADMSAMKGYLNASNVSIVVPEASAPVPIAMELHSNGSIMCEARCAFASSVYVRGQWALSGDGPLVIESSSSFHVGSRYAAPLQPRLRSGGVAIVRGILRLCELADEDHPSYAVGSIRFSMMRMESSSAELDLCDGDYRQVGGKYVLNAPSVVEGNIEVLGGHLWGTGRIMGNLTLAASAIADLSMTRNFALDPSSTLRALQVAGSVAASEGSTLHFTAHAENTNGQAGGLRLYGPMLSSHGSMQLLGTIVVMWRWLGSDEINISGASEPLVLASSPSLTGSWQHQQQRRVGKAPVFQAAISSQQDSFQGQVRNQSLVAHFVGCISGSAGTHTCSPCGAGSFSKRWLGVLPLICRQCPVGYFQNTAGRDGCVACHPGTYTNLSGSIACSACPSGQVSSGANASCKTCREGEYPDEAAAACLTCPLGKYLPAGTHHCEQDPATLYEEEIITEDLSSISNSSSSSSPTGPTEVHQQIPQGTPGDLPFGYLLGLGVLGFVTLGTGLACCGCGDLKCYQRTSHLRRMLPSSQPREPTTHRAWNLRKLDSIAKGSDEVLKRFVHLREEGVSKSLGAVVLSASYSVSGSEFAEKDACFKMAAPLLTGPADPTETEVESEDASRMKFARGDGGFLAKNDIYLGDAAAWAVTEVAGGETEVDGECFVEQAKDEDSADWEEHFDEQYGLPYFFHVPSATSVWEKPACLARYACFFGGLYN